MSSVGPVSSPVNLSSNLFQNTQEFVTVLSAFVHPFLFLIPSLPWRGSYFAGSVLAGAYASLDSDLKTESEKSLAWVKGALEFVPFVGPALQIVSETKSDSSPESSSFVMGCLGFIADISLWVLKKNKIPALPGFLAVVEGNALQSVVHRVVHLSVLEKFIAKGTKILDTFHVSGMADLDRLSIPELDRLLLELNRLYIPYCNNQYTALFSYVERDKFLIEFNRIGGFITQIENIFILMPIVH